MREVTRNPEKSVRDIAISLNLSHQTVQMYINSIGLYKRIPKRKLLLTKFTKSRNLIGKNISKDENFWKHAIFLTYFKTTVAQLRIISSIIHAPKIFHFQNYWQ